MKCYKNILIFVASLFMTACTNDVVVDKVEGCSLDLTIDADVEMVQGRASFDSEDVSKVEWSAGDAINVVVTGSNSKFATGVLTTEMTGATAKFTGSVSSEDPLVPPFSIYAVYGATSLNNSVATFQLGNLAPKMAAKTPEAVYYLNTISLNFKQVASGIHLKDLPSQVKSITLTPKTAANIGGTYTYNLVSETATANSGSLSSSVTNGEVWLDVAPGNYADGFVLQLYDENHNSQIVTLSGLNVERGSCYSIPTISTFSPLSISLASASAYHIDENGSASDGTQTDVNGSELSFGEVSFSGAPASMVSEIGVRVYSGSTVIATRSTSGSKTFAASKITDSYKSHGTSYEIRGFAIVNGTTYETAGKNVTFSRPSIRLSSPSGSYTSYTSYLASGASAANALDGSSVYLSESLSFSGVTASLFSTMGGSASITCDGANQGANISGQTISKSSILSGQSWSSHTIAASVTFDGATFNAPNSRTVAVTGLPYYVNPPSNGGNHPWSNVNGNITWKGDCVQLYYSAASYPSVATPAFNIPSDINVYVSSNVTRNYYWVSVKGKFSITQYDSGGNSGTSIVNEDIARSEAKTYTNLQGVMTNSYNRWILQYGYAAAGPETYIYNFRISYR